jgi:hypothetical protein
MFYLIAWVFLTDPVSDMDRPVTQRRDAGRDSFGSKHDWRSDTPIGNALMPRAT